LRIVDKTAYAEDLASTNGTRSERASDAAPGGAPRPHRVGHKLHFFDDELPRRRISNLETTVHTDSRRR
jgi:hypothetical protein